jgi:hypothetical protein
VVSHAGCVVVYILIWKLLLSSWFVLWAWLSLAVNIHVFMSP